LNDFEGFFKMIDKAKLKARAGYLDEMMKVD